MCVDEPSSSMLMLFEARSAIRTCRTASLFLGLEVTPNDIPNACLCNLRTDESEEGSVGVDRDNTLVGVLTDNIHSSDVIDSNADRLEDMVFVENLGLGLINSLREHRLTVCDVKHENSVLCGVSNVECLRGEHFCFVLRLISTGRGDKQKRRRECRESREHPTRLRTRLLCRGNCTLCQQRQPADPCRRQCRYCPVCQRRCRWGL